MLRPRSTPIVKVCSSLAAAAVAAGSLVGCDMSRVQTAFEAVRYQPPEPKPAPEPGPPVPWHQVASSVRGKPIQAANIGAGSRRVYVLGGLHGDAPEGPAVMDRLLGELPRSEAARVALVRLIRDGNPDGSAAGTRTNTRGVDLDRNWPAKDFAAGASSGPRALSELETASLHADLTAFDPQVVLVLESASFGPFITYSAPEGVAGAPLAYRFAAGARTEDGRWRVAPPIPNPPGSLASLLSEKGGRPVLTVTLKKGDDAERQARVLAAAIASLAEGL